MSVDDLADIALVVASAIRRQDESRLTKRETFALAAMQGQLAANAVDAWTLEHIAELSFVVADAMLEESVKAVQP